MLELHNVSKTFNKGTSNEKEALKNISLTINDGEFVCVIGGNGCGKSTLMNIISGSIISDTGSISIDGTDVTFLREDKRAPLLGRVFQDPKMGTAGNMLIEENLALANRRGKRRGLSWGINQIERDMYKEALRPFGLGLEDRLDTKVELLSGGQRQALTLLMATLKTPKLLLLDEHTAALDPKTQKIVMEATERIVRENSLTTLMITHNMKDALEYGNRLIMLKNGEIALDVKGDEKSKLTVEKLVSIFNDL